MDLAADSPTAVNADFISEIIPMSATIGIGAAVLFFYDGTSMNISETVQQVQEMIAAGHRHYFENSFSKN